ncbi:MAG: transglutaminase-like domain-containing protein [Halanaerobium sp.]|nr:transglutaminase-like domain-containing protein [Halanaerobium sp.]
MKQKTTLAMIIIVLAVLFTVLPLQAADVELKQEDLPALWTLQKTVAAPEEQLPAFSQKLGGKIAGIKNYLINAGGFGLQINTIQGKDAGEAGKVYGNLVNATGNPAQFHLAGNTVIEFVCQNNYVFQKARDVLGLYDGKEYKYNISFTAAPLAGMENPMELNRLANLLVKYQVQQNNDYAAAIEGLRGDFTFAERLDISLPLLAGGRSIFAFSGGVTSREENGLVRYTLEKTGGELGIPQVSVAGEVTVRPFASYKEDNLDRELYTRETASWPISNVRVKELAEQIAAGKKTDREKVEAILAWIRQNLSYQGETGSRYGVEQALEQGYGRCLDYTDVMVSLARAAGLPARMVLGWVRNMAGHAWVEVYLEGEGWTAVDATTSWLGVSEDYIPLSISTDGEIPFTYWMFPTIEQVVEK